MLVAHSKNALLVKMLIGHGADANARTAQEATAMNCAISNKSVLALLLPRIAATAKPAACGFACHCGLSLYCSGTSASVSSPATVLNPANSVIPQPLISQVPGSNAGESEPSIVDPIVKTVDGPVLRCDALCF